MTESSTGIPATAREIFEHWQQTVLRNDHAALGRYCADDVVIETPFAAPGIPGRFTSREAFLAYARPRQQALPARFEGFRQVVVHDTADPNVIVAEYELHGTVTTTGQRASAGFITIITVRDGKVVRWREYQDTLRMAAALGQLPALLASFSGG